MKHVRKFLVGIAAGFALAVIMGGAASPAYAAGTVVYVDDGPANNGSTKCPATTNTTIENGITAIGSAKTNVTLYICPGFYNPATALVFSNFTNLKIIGKGSPIITTPAGFAGGFFYIAYSTKVTVQGLNISGGSQLGSIASSVAIYFHFTSGTIKGNTISNWHVSYSGAPPVAVAVATSGISSYAPGDTDKVNITKNSIYDSQDTGIYVYGGGAAKVTKNRIVFSSAIIPDSLLGLAHVQAGVLLSQTAPGAVVSGNQIESDSDLYPTNGYSRGILVYATSKAKVTKNTVRGTAHQISIESYCGNASFPDANSNTISGNKLYDTWFEGVSIYAQNTGGSCSEPHADFNKVSGNKIYTGNLNSLTPWGAHVVAGGSGVADADVIKGNTFAGFYPGLEVMWSGATNLVSGPNKILSAPPTGPLAAPAEPVTHEPPGPLPAYLLEPLR